MKKSLLIILMFISSLSFSQETKVSPDKEKLNILYTKAVEKLENKDIDGAFNDANKIIKSDSMYSKAYYLRGYINCFYKKEPELSINDFTRLIQLDSTNARAFLYRANSYESLYKSLEAILDYNNSIRLDSANLNAYYRRGICKANIEDYLGAINDYDFILNYKGERKDEFSQWATVYCDKAYCFVELKKPREALPFINESLKLDESFWYSWHTRGEVYFKLEEFQKCIDDMDLAISIQETSYSFYYRGLAKIKLGKKIEGCSDLSKANELGAEEAAKALKENCN